MQVSIFGGAIKGSVHVLLDLIYEEILQYKPKQVLLLPFVRPTINPEEKEWHANWYKEFFCSKDSSIEFLDASNREELKRANNPLIFISGGKSKANLINKIMKSHRLRDLIKSTQSIVAESGGAMALGAYSRSEGVGSPIIRGLDIVKNTIIEPHYFEKNRAELLKEEMKVQNLPYGIGIDSNSGIRFDPNDIFNHVLLGNKQVDMFRN